MRAQLGDRTTLPLAIEKYHTETDRFYIGSGPQALAALADPAMWKQLKYRTGRPQWFNERLVFVVRSHGGDEHAFRFVEAFYREFVVGRNAFQHMTCVAAFEELGERRAVPYLRNILVRTERKRDAAAALGSLHLGLRGGEADAIAADRIRGLIRTVSSADTSPTERNAALEELAKNREAAMRFLADGFRLRDRLTATRYQPVKRHEWTPWRALGEAGVKRLLAASEGCSLVARYHLARALSLMDRRHFALIRQAAVAPQADPDQRRTAILALGWADDTNSGEALVPLLRNEAYRSDAIIALSRLGRTEDRRALEDLRRRLAKLPAPNRRQRVWLKQLQTALH